MVKDRAGMRSRRRSSEPVSQPQSSMGPKSGQKLRFVDLFCGIGGFRLGFERAGARCVWSCDWDKYCQKTYEANFGELPYGDIHSMAVADIPAFDSCQRTPSFPRSGDIQFPAPARSPLSA